MTTIGDSSNSDEAETVYKYLVSLTYCGVEINMTNDISRVVNDNFMIDNYLDNGSRLQAGLVQHRHHT